MKSRSRLGKAGTLADLKRHLWAAVKAASSLLDDPDEHVRLRAVHATSQAASAYRATLEASLFDVVKDLEDRLQQAGLYRGDPPKHEWNDDEREIEA